MHYYSNLKKSFEKSVEKKMREQMSYNSSFGLIDYNQLNATMNVNGYSKFYEAYKKDIQLK